MYVLCTMLCYAVLCCAVLCRIVLEICYVMAALLLASVCFKAVSSIVLVFRLYLVFPILRRG